MKANSTMIAVVHPYSDAHTADATNDTIGVNIRLRPASGAYECDKCEPGQYQNNIGSAQCKGCAAGQYTAAWAAHICTNCPVGKYQDATGASSCTSCQPGKTTNVTGSTSCTACPVHTHQVGYGAADCNACPPGQYQLDTGSTGCHQKYSFSATEYSTPDCSGNTDPYVAVAFGECVAASMGTHVNGHSYRLTGDCGAMIQTVYSSRDCSGNQTLSTTENVTQHNDTCQTGAAIGAIGVNMSRKETCGAWIQPTPAPTPAPTQAPTPGAATPVPTPTAAPTAAPKDGGSTTWEKGLLIGGAALLLVVAVMLGTHGKGGRGGGSGGGGGGGFSNSRLGRRAQLTASRPGDRRTLLADIESGSRKRRY